MKCGFSKATMFFQPSENFQKGFFNGIQEMTISPSAQKLELIWQALLIKLLVFFNSYCYLTCSVSENSRKDCTCDVLKAILSHPATLQPCTSVQKGFPNGTCPSRDYISHGASGAKSSSPAAEKLREQSLWRQSFWSLHFSMWPFCCMPFKSKRIYRAWVSQFKFLVLFDSNWWVDIDRTSAWMNFKQSSINPWVIWSTPVWLRINAKTIIIGSPWHLYHQFILFWHGHMDRFWRWQNVNSPNF